MATLSSVTTMAAGARCQTLSLYKELLRESQKFSTYNFKEYALRRVRDAFKQNKTLTDEKQISNQLKFAKDNLNIIKRQVMIGQQYSTEKLIIEK